MQQTQQQEERRQLIDRVLALDPATYLYAGLGANVGLIETEIERQVRQGALDWSAYDVQNIHRVAVNAVQRGALATNQRSVEAFQVAFSGDAAQKSGIGANEQMIISELVKRDLPCTTENVLTIISELWNQLADNSTYSDNKAEIDKRNAQIAEMTGNGEHGFSVHRTYRTKDGLLFDRKIAYTKDGHLFDPMHGQAQGFSMGISGPWSRGAGSKSFDEMTNQEVEDLFNAWSATESYKNMSVEDLRKLVKSNGGKNKTVPIVAAPSDRQLINPATGAQFTQRELHRFATNFPQDARKLISDPNTGRMVPWKKDLFEKIWRGELQ